ncbi:hypothetical protein F9K33_00390 [bacterium]|nr:MAG: hypothetical protein F9K33_00390 [bacterium]
MKTKIRLIQIGSEVTQLISNVVVSLNQLQDSFSFDISNETITLDSSKIINGLYPETYIWEQVEQYLKKHNYTEYPIAVCDFPLFEEIFCSHDEVGALISTYGMVDKLKFSIDKFLKYVIAYVIIDPKNERGQLHMDKTLSCPNDFCDNVADVNLGMAKGEFCRLCKGELFSAIDKNELSLSTLTAVYRILDDVSDKRICFVLMPFAQKFTGVYHNVKAIMKQHGYYCVRADEIFETRSVINIIYQMIERSTIIIADLTGRNANVFFELGYAHAIGKNTILMAQKQSDIPFDLQHRQFFKYKNGPELKKILSEKIGKYVA